MRRPMTYDPQRDYYAILGIDAHSTRDQIRRAYRKAVQVAHPDRNPDRIAWATEQLTLLNEAYDVLSSPELRRRYDHARWPYAPQAPAAPPPKDEPGGTSSDSPWWDQTSRRTPGSPWFTPRRARAFAYAPEPYWLVVADWLKAHRLGWLESVWMTLVGLWRSPYGGMIALLTVVLGINLAFVAYGLFAPGRDPNLCADLCALLNPSAPRPTSPASINATPDRLNILCADPDIKITQPAHNDEVGESFSIYGVIQPENLHHYALLAGFLGSTFERTALPERWLTLRPPPDDSSVIEPPVPGGLLAVSPVTLPGEQTGYWVLRLVVTLRDGTQLRPCDVVVHRP